MTSNDARRPPLARHVTVARVNHWITGICFVLLLLSGLAMFHPVHGHFLSELFGGGQFSARRHSIPGSAR